MIDAIQTTANATMEIPVGWVLTSFVGLGSIIATLATSLYQTLKASILTLQGRIAAQDEIIEGLQDDIERMSKGCGMDHCIWKHRS